MIKASLGVNAELEEAVLTGDPPCSVAVIALSCSSVMEAFA